MLTTKQAAEQMGAAQISVRKWALAGRLPGAVHWGRDWMIPEEAVAAFLVEGKRRAGRPRKSPSDAGQDRLSQ